eukprot:scaffold1401_cov330-Pavlova_lutheri.AAC.161
MDSFVLLSRRTLSYVPTMHWTTRITNSRRRAVKAIWWRAASQNFRIYTSVPICTRKRPDSLVSRGALREISATERFDRTNETIERSRSSHHYLRPGGWGMTWELWSRHVTPRAFETRVHRTVCRPLHCHEQATQSVPIASYHEVCSPQNQPEVYSAVAEPFTHQPVGSTPQDVRIHLRSGTSEFQGTKRRRSVKVGHYDASALPDLQLFLVHAYCEDERLSTTCGSVLATC